MSLKGRLEKLWHDAYALNNKHIVQFAAAGKATNMLDVGCGDGSLTQAIAQGAGIAQVDVVEIEPHAIERAKSFGYGVFSFDLNAPLAIDSDRYDLIVTNQVIEHLYDTDLFVSELYRITKPGGTAIVSTENAASWHNILALILGWQAFSLTNVSRMRAGIGNPFALHSGEDGASFLMQHHRIFSLRGLCDVLAVHGFVGLQARGSGYYPLPAAVGNFDRYHAHFITVAGVKPPAGCALVDMRRVNAAGPS